MAHELAHQPQLRIDPAEHDAAEFVTLDEALQRVPHKGLKVGIVRALQRAAAGR